MRRFFIRILSGLLIAGLSFILLFSILSLFFPLPDRVEYSTVVLDDRGEVIHAFLTRDQQWRMKTSLQEIAASLELGVPRYVLTSEGPDHAKTFTAEVHLGPRVFAGGTGRSKKEAEQEVAEIAWRLLNSEAPQPLDA